MKCARHLKNQMLQCDILDVMDLSTETELGTEFLDGMQALMDKYSETLQKETDWVTLVIRKSVPQKFAILV